MCINRSFLNLEKVPFLCIVFLREGKKLLIIKKLIKIYLICFCLIFFLSEKDAFQSTNPNQDLQEEQDQMRIKSHGVPRNEIQRGGKPPKPSGIPNPSPNIERKFLKNKFLN